MKLLRVFLFLLLLNKRAFQNTWLNLRELSQNQEGRAMCVIWKGVLAYGLADLSRARHTSQGPLPAPELTLVPVLMTPARRT